MVSRVARSQEENHEIMKKISEWDMSHVRRMMEDQGFNADAIMEMETEYKRFIFIAVVNGRATIAAPLDPFWHTHVLFTRDYARFGQHIVGKTLHHTPVAKSRTGPLQPQYNRTREQYKEIFGFPSPVWWPDKGQVCRCDIDD